ncbi:MAG TPA: SdrD B-like domain-containing protein [Saprospiraceae bacterium]|nr:SdrD B-like domain-containing protein [Saprospiraceae bacterium]HNE63134.1 SdrD B-like domain-containing protein [Saprospiraceae bacterium]HNM54947.1 SdrD B-like domain-containing protein [Saprospiraceae bacterium]
MKTFFHQIARNFKMRFTLTAFASVMMLLMAAFAPMKGWSQTVKTEKAIASGCYYYGGASKTTISVQVGWTGAVNGDIIKVVLDGSTTRNIKPESFYDPGTGSAIAGPMVTPQVVAFEINADGISHKIEVDLFSSTNVLKASGADYYVTAPTPCAPIACSGTALGGMVYFDNNADGIHDAGETQGIENVTVTAFDKNGNVYNATSDGYGKYAFSAALGNNIPTANFPVRLEFTNWPTNVMGNSGPSITGNKSSVRFVAAAACNVDCGGVYPLNYSQSNPTIFNNIYTNGDPLAGGTAGNEPGLISHAYTNNTDYNITTIVKQNLIGSAWAKAWNKFEKKLIVASFLKRHSGYGPLGPGGLYILNYTNPGSPVFSQLIDITTIGINVGQALIPSNAARGLLANKDTPNKDAAVFGLVAKAGIGGIDLSEDGNMLYLMNLYDRKIYSINFTNYWNTGTLPTASDVTSYAVPDPGCTGGDYRPFALKVYNGVLYTGMVCDGSTGTKSNMVAYVKGMDLTTNTWFDVFDFPLTYPKGYPDQQDGSKVGWYKWSDVMSDVWNGTGSILHPVPIFSDIEFDLDGTMVLALMDRTPQQMGHENYDNPALNGGAFIAAGGDYLRAFYSNGAYVLENAAKAGPNVGFYPTNNQGPGFGEFYNDNIDGGVKYHTEMGTGGLVLVPGSGEVLAGMVDPNFYAGGPLYANGVRRMSNTTGNHTGGFSYIAGNSIDNFAKGIGIGDMEAATNNLTYIELGNYVWRDSDADGIQDPAETGVSGIILKLYKSSDGSLIGTATTDANGNYYFSTLSGLSILPNTDYCILAGVGQYVTGPGTITLGGITYSLTAFNTGQGADPDLNDNDFTNGNLSTALGARPAGYPQFCVKTGEYGYINHTIDMGLIPCSITGTATPTACKDNGTPYNTADDYFQVVVNATNGAAGPANMYEVVYNNVVIGTGTYGTSITVGNATTPPFKPDGTTTYDLYIRDKDHPDCITGVIKVGPVTPCPKYYDWGDLPDTNSGLPNSYATNNTNGGEGLGPNHLIIDGLKIGNTIDSENDGQPNTGATGDGNDEDGVTLPMFIAGQTATVPVTVMNMTGGDAKLTMFIDFNKNGNLNEASEMASATVPTGTNGIINLSILVPTNAIANQNIGVRFRLSTDAASSMIPTGAAPDGEVEDYITQIMAYDYGDLPDTDNGSGSYPTNTNNGGEGIGASHKIITGLKMGASVDAEADGQPNTLATGDGSDEDGVTLPMLIAGTTVTVPVTVMNTTGATAKLTMFVDFNLDHDFNDAGEMVSANVSTGTNGVVNLTLPVPADAVLNKSLGVRFRLSTDATKSMSPTGSAPDGEVEDYLTTVMGYDYGDLQDTNNGAGSYPTNLTNGGEGVGPSHKIVDGLKIGTVIDAEGNGQPSTLADGDDNNGSTADDEEGVTLPAFNTGNTAIIPVRVMNMTGTDAKLTMFIDFNNNKNLADPGEMTSITVPAGTNSTLNMSILVPVTAATNTNLGVRFRLSTDAAASMIPTGAAPDGEVEDYVTSITGSVITHNKSIKKVTSTGLNQYLVEYTINVINSGSGSGTYKLEDRTAFDNDINILSASYTSNAPGNLGPVNLIGSGIWTLASNQTINANTTHTYTVGVNVSIDLLDGVTGDDKYTNCGKAITNYPSSGEGLFNESILDIYADGSVDQKDTACTDLPFIIHDKTLGTVTQVGVNTYDVVYGILVKNIGGATGQYDLQDEPMFDDDITQVSAKVLSSITGVTTTLGVPGPWLLANNQSIAAGASQNYTLTVRVKLDLEDGVVGDDQYTSCGTLNPGIPNENEGLFNRSLLDVNDDGKFDYRDSVCTDIPYIVHEKLIDNVVTTGINKYKITYKIIVKNIGGASGSYNLSDAPGFDDDITITASQYSTNAAGNPGNPGPVALAGSGPWTLATNQNISAGATQTFTIPVDVTVSLEAGSGGDNILKACGQAVPGVPRVGEGLFNRSLLDLDKNGTPDRQDSVCYDIPYIIHDKEIVSVVPNGANAYIVNYKINVKNVGTVSGNYGLADAPNFDNDINIQSASYTSNAPGFLGPNNLAGNGPWTLSTNVSLGAGATHTYNLAVKVNIDLLDGVSGDDSYYACNRSSSTHYTAGEGLFNESRLDLNNDGLADMKDTVCADLPFIIHDKTLGSVTPVGVNTYDVVYGILVKNIGGAVGQYDLQDEPMFDDDITQVSAKVLSSVTGVTTSLGVPGPWLLVNNQSIAAGASHNYTLTVRVKLDLEDGVSGDDKYTSCGTFNPGVPKENEGLFNRSLLDVNDDGKFDYRDSVCTDIPYIVHEKLVDNVTQTGINKYKVTYKIIVKNIGGASGSYNLSDAPGFDDDITITASQYSTNAAGNPGNPGPVALAGSGPWTLATNQNISAGATQTFTIPVDVTVSLEAGSGGDNILKACGQAVPGVPRVGEGLFNRSLLDLDKNGTPDRQDSVCYDIPYIIHDKEIVSVVPNGANAYIVNYKINVKNVGTVSGNYGLADAPNFDNDINIQSASYTSNAPGFLGPNNLAGNGPWTLSTNVSLGAGATHTYNLAVKVNIDLLDGVSGDDSYYACNRSSSTHYTAGEGLFNESRLDLNNDGLADMKDTVCADLPFIIHDKTISSVTPVAINTYDVVYNIDVKNIGGATGTYDLDDEPEFEDDITQISAKFLSSATGITTSLVIPGPWKLANNQTISAGSTQKYTITVRVKIDLEDGVSGDDHYDACGSSAPGTPKDFQGLFNRSLLDINDDGKPDYRDSVCADLPYVVHEKLIDNVTQTGINKYKVTYKIIVKNIGGATGSYNLSDAPGFDDDITITASQYSTNASGNPGNPGPVALAGTGPWTLATNQSINAGAVQVFTIPVDVSVSLAAGSGGDNVLKACGQTVPGIPRVGEGLFNRSLLDLDKNGTPDRQDSVCYDLPYIIHDKEIVSVVQTGATNYTVNYKITVKNIGTITGTYGLADAPAFDNDIAILAARYTSDAPSYFGPIALAGIGPWTLSSGVNLAAGGTHTYNLAVDVKIDLIDGTSGDDVYFACGRSSSTHYTAGEGLFNESRLDLNNDGLADMRDTVCADLPFVIHDKTIISVTPTGVNTYDVVYGIDVRNIGGATGKYDLRDEPKFDNDIAMLNAKYLSSVTGTTTSLAVPGPWILASNQSINAGALQKYTITVGVAIDLEDGLTGDDRYSSCGTQTPGMPGENEGLFNRSLLDVNHDGAYDYRDSVCADIPYIVHEKIIDNVVSTGINKYKITYKINVKNIGGAAGLYNLSDAPGFDDDITITAARYSSNAAGNAGNPGPVILAGTGPWTLAVNQNINPGTTQTFTIPVDVSISLAAGSGGDNILRSCGQTVPGVPRVGEGLFNRSLLDIDRNGTPDRQDSVCYDLPYIVHEKQFVGTTQTGARTFKVDYKIIVRNIGTAAGTYGLADAPAFDNDIDITSASFTSNAPGYSGPLNLAGSGPWNLSNNVNIGANGVHTYNIAVNVRFDLSTSTGDKVYNQCGKANPNLLTAGEGLFNESRLDLDNDGLADMRDTVCADLPYVEHQKYFTSVVKTGLGMYTVKYKVEVKNRGGAVGTYDLIDNPGLDDDFEIVSAKLSSDASGNPATPGPVSIANNGPWVFANDQNINPGGIQTYNLSLDVKIDLQTVSSAGDEVYNYCGTHFPGIPSKGEGLFNESTLDVNNDGLPDQRDSVCQDVEIVDLALRKQVVTAGPYAYGQDITFSIQVVNQGNVTMNQVEVTDHIPIGYSLAPGNVGWTGVYPNIKKVIPGPLAPGSSLTTNLVLRLKQTQGGRMDWVNYAEVSKTINSRGEDVSLDDEDSRPASDGPAERAVKPGDVKDDDIFSRDKGGEEDDHDPAGIEVYDLALRKIYKGAYPIHYNDVVPFEITIFNQGNISSKEISIVDYIPQGYEWDVALNGGWSYNSLTRMATTTYPGTIVPGDSAKVTVYVKVLVNYSGIKAWDNYSEIKSTKDTTGVVRTKDIDSNFDMIPDNDMGGVPDTKSDNFIDDDGNDGDGDGIKDEDDHDPARPQIVDLALRKWVLNKKPYYIPGEIVPYTLTVFNQGNVIMNSVTVNDYLFAGYSFDPAINPGWTLVGSTLSKTQVGTLNPNDSMQFQLKLKVQVPVGASVESWWNYGEVKGMIDTNGKVRDNDDADSKSNSDSPYERNVKPGDPWDNVIDGQGQPENEDEDDHDPEKVIVTAYLGDYVWKDDNGNGVQDITEHGIKGVEVQLYDCKTNTLVRKDTTDVNGEYGFEFLLSGTYYVKFINPDPEKCGFTFKDKGGNDKKDNDANDAGITDCIFLDWGQRDSTADAGLVLWASYGDYTWHDRNANGMQEAGEEPIAGVKVTLYNGDTKLSVRTTITDGNGLYRFTKLLPGNYYAKFDADPMWVETDANTSNDVKDSDVDGSNGVHTTATTFLSPGEDDLTWDAGYWKCSMIGGRVFLDADMDGVFDFNENGINGLKVYLVNAMTGVSVAQLLTAVNPATPSDDGYYKFPCVKPGMYYIRFERPGHLAASEPFKGGNPDKDSDISHENGVNTTRKFTITSDNMLINIGAGFQTKAMVGDFVWLDTNFNGLQDAGEQPVEGVKVMAVKLNGTIVSESTTEADGHYTLDGIAQGDYFVKFDPPANLSFTVAHAGSDEVDNDADGTNGYGTTRTYRVNPGDVRPSVDAGLVFQVLPLEWLSFDGRFNGSFTELDWKTGVELNNDHFEVERRHESETAFTKIAQVEASTAPANKIHVYDHDDYDMVRPGVYYYRIRQVDRNGQFTYSRTISVRVEGSRELNVSIYPNPTDEKLIIDLGLGEDTDLEVRVFDEAGKNVLTNPFSGFRKAGFYRETLNTSVLIPGHYNMQIKTTQGLINKKFTVAR